MTGHEKRGYIYSAISFVINPVFGIIQGIANYAFGRWAEKQVGLDTLHDSYYSTVDHITFDVERTLDGKVKISSDRLIGRGSKRFPITIEKELIFEGVACGELIPVTNQFRA
jgi:hypothetical protein